MTAPIQRSFQMREYLSNTVLTRASRTGSNRLAVTAEIDETCRVRDLSGLGGSVPSNVMFKADLPDNLEGWVCHGRSPNVESRCVRNGDQSGEEREERAERASCEHCVVFVVSAVHGGVFSGQ